jgi:hypothetical protein
LSSLHLLSKIMGMALNGRAMKTKNGYSIEAPLSQAVCESVF